MFGKSKEPMALDSERVEEFAKILRKKAGELTVAEEVVIHIYRSGHSSEFYEAIGIVMKEIGIFE